MKKLMLLLGVALVLPTGMAFADEADKLHDVTMQVVEGDKPDALLKRIELPERAQERAHEKSAQGTATANQVRERAQER